MDPELFATLDKAFHDAYPVGPHLEELLLESEYQELGDGWLDMTNHPSQYLVLREEGGPEPGTKVIYAVDPASRATYEKVRIKNTADPSKHVYRLWRITTDGDRDLEHDLLAITRIKFAAHAFHYNLIKAVRASDERLGWLTRQKLFKSYIRPTLTRTATASYAPATADSRSRAVPNDQQEVEMVATVSSAGSTITRPRPDADGKAGSSSILLFARIAKEFRDAYGNKRDLEQLLFTRDYREGVNGWHRMTELPLDYMVLRAEGGPHPLTRTLIWKINLTPDVKALEHELVALAYMPPSSHEVHWRKPAKDLPKGFGHLKLDQLYRHWFGVHPFSVIERTYGPETAASRVGNLENFASQPQNLEPIRAEFHALAKKLGIDMETVRAPFLMDANIFQDIQAQFWDAFEPKRALEELHFPTDYVEEEPGWEQVTELPLKYPGRDVYRVWKVTFDVQRPAMVHELVALARLKLNNERPNQVPWDQLRPDLVQTRMHLQDRATLYDNWFKNAHQNKLDDYVSIHGPITADSIVRADTEWRKRGKLGPFWAQLSQEQQRETPYGLNPQRPYSKYFGQHFKY
ncbi:hypothetical protein BCV70DRAFT_217524 [Testicularia cyperi]|uniref:Uncharacterized protein n=1 Tax=Testicularia cyperi TaxID=1882483 RepID=A0A317XR28_9BASI|nr:hypothetical protein BCV70DRAFT_217524 [Testicularia cyperi]